MVMLLFRISNHGKWLIFFTHVLCIRGFKINLVLEAYFFVSLKGIFFKLFCQEVTVKLLVRLQLKTVMNCI